MKKIVSILFLLLCAVATWAAKAGSRPFTVTQPDGKQVTVVLRGDEHANWYSTPDGTLLVQKGQAYYVAKTEADGTLTATSLLIHEAADRTAAEQEAISAQDKSLFFKSIDQTQARARRAAVDTDKHYFPHTGSPKVLVLLVEFADTTFSLTNPKESFDQYLNGDGELKDLGASENKNYGSALQYFREMSYGTFTPKFDIYGPYKLSGASATYGKENDRMDLLVPQACQTANEDVNFADYDTDGDGYVDLVYIIYAGYSANVTGASTDYIWPKSGTLSNGGTYDGKKVYRYGVNNELIALPASFKKAPYKRINGLGLFVHEFSHTLGLPDLYATTESASTLDNQGMEFWSVMDGGENNNNGYYPTAYTAWEREVMGWFKPDTLKDTCTVSGLVPIGTDGGKAYKIFKGNTKEYVMLENIQQTGWNTKLCGHGLLTYRIAYNTEVVNSSDRPNDKAGEPKVVVLAADGCLDNISKFKVASDYYASMAGDTYPGTSNVTDIASFTWLDGSTMLNPVLNISETDRQITFDYLGKKKDTPSAILTPTVNEEQDKSIYTLDGRHVGTDASRLTKGIYIIGGRKVVK